jgi:hypothetical protein
MFSNDKRVFNKMMKKVEIYLQVKDLVGDVVEFGVFKGAGLALFLKLKQMYEPNSLMKVIGFDYFQSDKLLDSLDGINKQGMADVLARAPSADLLVDSVNTRLLPLDKDNYITRSITIPAKNSDAKYSLELDWEAPNGYDKDFMNESIIVVASKKPIAWLSVYDMQRFKEKLMEIPLNQRRVVQRPYVLIK